MLARLDRLPADARERVLAVENVDGAPVVVTRMILDFDSFGKWLDRVAPPPSGGFTDIFVSSGTPRGAPVAEIDSPTMSWTPPSVPKTPPPPEPKSEPKPHAPAISVRFREPGSGPKPPAAPPPKPPTAPPPKPPAAPLPPPSKAAPGEFTRIFGATRSEPDPAPPAPQFMPPPPPMPSGGSSGAAPSATSAMERVVAPPPRPAAPPPPPLSPSSPWSGPPPVVPLPPSQSGSATPMPGANINLPPSAPVMPAQPVQSDFTRIIGAAGPSPVAPVTPAAPAPAPAPTPAPVAAASKKIAAVLLGFGALLVAALGLVIMALFKRH